MGQCGHAREGDAIMYEDEPVADYAAAAPSKDSRQFAMFCHLGALTTLVGIPGFIVPLVIWLVKREEDSFIDFHGKEALNFQISVYIYAIALTVAMVILMLVVVGVLLIPVLIALAIAALILPVIAGIKANDGDFYRYPFTIRLIP